MNNKITVLFHDRIAGHRKGDVVDYDDGPFVRWLLGSDRIELVDPPTLDWLDKPETHPEYKEDPSPIRVTKAKVRDKYKDKDGYDGEGYSQTSAT